MSQRAQYLSQVSDKNCYQVFVRPGFLCQFSLSWKPKYGHFIPAVGCEQRAKATQASKLLYLSPG